MTALLRILALIWQSPIAIPMWLFYVLPLYMFGQIKWDGWDRSGVAKWRIKLVSSWYTRLWSGWYGFAGPGFMLLHPLARRVTIRHERRHCYQWMAFGPLFPIVYLIGLCVGAISGNAYYENPLERDARKASITTW